MSGWRAGALGLVGLLTWSGCEQGAGGLEPSVRTGPEQQESNAVPQTSPDGIEREASRTPGGVHWTVDEQAPGRQDVVSVASDGEGGFVLLGTSELPAAPGAPAERDSTTLRLSRYGAGGTLQWTRSFTPEPASGRAGDLEARALAVSPSGDIFVLARVTGRLSLGDVQVEDTAFLVKLSSEGAPRWVRPQADLPQQRLAADAAGGVVVLHGLTVTRHDATGAPSWSWTSTVPMDFGAVAADAAGGALVAGSRQVDAFHTQGVIVRLSAQGRERWRLDVGGDGASFTGAALHADGGVVLVGESLGRFPWGTDVVETPCQVHGCFKGVFALAADAEGRPRWGRVLDSQDRGGSENPRLTLDTRGAAAVVWSHAEGSQLRRLSPLGDDLWRAAYDNGPGACGRRLQDVAFLPGGDLVGAGTHWGTCPRPEGGAVTATESDVFLQRLSP